MKHTILVIDDEKNNVDALERLFRKKYTVLKAISADEGLELVKKNTVSLIITDQRMPNKTGVEFLKESREFVPNAMRILLTGYTDIESAIEAINSGEVYRYISKPWDPADLSNTIDKAIQQYETTAELAEKNLALNNALDELKVLDEAKDQFMMLINHELKTPLTVIKSFLELLGETKVSADQKKYMSRIDQSTDRLQRLVDDSLSFVSAETGKMKVSVKKTSTDQIFKKLSESSNKQVNLTSDKISLKTDAKLVIEVLDRLIENALHHGDKNKSIKVSANKESGGIRFNVENQGKAISKKVIEGLGRSFNLDKDMMKHHAGLGLGLSLSQAILKRLGSELEFENSKKKILVSFVLSQ